MPFLRVDRAGPVEPTIKNELLRRTDELLAEIIGSRSSARRRRRLVDRRGKMME